MRIQTPWSAWDYFMFKIIIIDNNVLFREGLTNLLQREAGIQIVDEAGSISEALEGTTLIEPDLALVEAELPDMEDFNGLRMLRAQYPRMQIVLISAHPSEELLIYAVRNGARGYLYKNCSLSKFMAAIRALERGEAVIPRAMVGRLLDEFTRLSSPAEQDGLGSLTPREMDVLCELGRGRSNRQIAERLNIAENTVKVHVHNILEKLNLRNRRQAARFARFQGVVNTKITKAYAAQAN
jgi:two-component system, NarL family, nitrate/nitrite response regulator NarL